MSTPNPVNLNNLDGRYVTPVQADAKVQSGLAMQRMSALNALESRVLKQLQTGIDWVRMQAGAKLNIGEVGWPNQNTDSNAWQAVGEKWYRMADNANLPVFQWGSGVGFGAGYPMSPFASVSRSTPASVRNAGVADVMDAHRSYGRTLRGLNVSGLEWTAGVNDDGSSNSAGFMNTNSGVKDTDYWVEPTATWAYLASQGVKAVRIPFRWERLQPTPGGAFDSTYQGYLQGMVTAARSAGLIVVLDCHNYGGYWVNSSGSPSRQSICMPSTYTTTSVTVQHFIDLWRKLSTLYKSDTGILYDLMNEPINMYGTPGEYYPTQILADFEDGGIGGMNASYGSTTLANTTASGTYHDGTKGLQLTASGSANYISLTKYYGGSVTATGSQFSIWVKPPNDVYINLAISFDNDQQPAIRSHQITGNKWNLVQVRIPKDRQYTKVRQYDIIIVGIPTGTSSVTYVDTIGFGEGIVGGTPAYTWESVSRATVAAIRNNGDAKKIYVPLYDFSNIDRCLANHPFGPWIDPIETQIEYTMHQYFDAALSGNYAYSYATEMTTAQNLGYGAYY